MMQTASASSSVQKALSFFVSIYRVLAEWRAVVARLDGFERGRSAAPQCWRPEMVQPTSCP
jgi:putative ATP-binding cassette transporter